jgi:chaperone modulatory protein CbpM
MTQELHITVYDDEHRFTLYEISDSCQVHAELIVEFVEHGLLEPEGEKPEHWRFSEKDLQRSQKALRLQQDLEVNLPGAALALELQEEIEQLKARLAVWEKLYR